jgi:hypothetical protein
MSQWWFASDKFSADGHSALISTTTGGSTDRDFKAAQTCRIIVEGGWIRDDRDGLFKGKNDLIVSTKFRAGENPPVDKVHLLEQEVPERRWVPIVFHPEIWATRDFNPEMGEIGFEVRVYDEDGLDDDEVKVLTSAMAGAASAAAVAFPVLAPYAAFAAGAGTALAKLVDTLDDHDELVRGRIRLSVNKDPNNGYDLLQPGFLICFSSAVDARKISLGQDRRLYAKKAEGDWQPFEHLSYVVLRVSREGPSSPQMELTQKMSTLLSELEAGKGGKSGEALKYLQNTFEAYSTMRRIQRYRDLSQKTQLSTDEKDLLKELGSDPAVRPYLGLKQPTDT